MPFIHNYNNQFTTNNISNNNNQFTTNNIPYYNNQFTTNNNQNNQNENYLLKYEIDKLNKFIIRLNDENNLLKKENQQLKYENQNLKNEINIKNNNLNIYQIKIDDLNNTLKNKNNEISVLSNEINNLKLNNNKENETIKKDELLSIQIKSIDQKVDTSFACKNSDLFVRIEEMLYDEFPEYKDLNTFFTVNGRFIKRFRSLQENEIKNKDKILLSIYE